MKTIFRMLIATILSLYTFCTSCWYAPSVIFDSVMPFVFVALSRVSSDCVFRVQIRTLGAGKPIESKNLEILDHRMETGEFGNLIIKGTAKNIESSSLSYAKVRVKFYNKEGRLAGYISGQYQ